MEADELQRVWQSQERGRQIAVDADLVLQLVRRNYRHFRREIFWPDMREVGVLMILAALFAYWGAFTPWGAFPHAWPWFAMAVICMFVGLFELGDYVRQKWKSPTPGETLVAWTESSLASVEHRTWLLKTVWWSSLLPIWIGLVLVFGDFGFRVWGVPDFGWRWQIEMFLVGCVFFVTACFYGTYRWNLRTIRTKLQPWKEELQKLLENLKASG